MPEFATDCKGSKKHLAIILVPRRPRNVSEQTVTVAVQYRLYRINNRSRTCLNAGQRQRVVLECGVGSKMPRSVMTSNCAKVCCNPVHQATIKS